MLIGAAKCSCPGPVCHVSCSGVLPSVQKIMSLEVQYPQGVRGSQYYKPLSWPPQLKDDCYSQPPCTDTPV